MKILNSIRNRLAILGVFLGTATIFLGIWQLDLICVGPVWQTGWAYLGNRCASDYLYAEQFFQAFLWQTTIGRAYDVFFSCIFIGALILVASAVSIDNSNRRMKKMLMKYAVEEE